ncbi:type III-A CRISPR-associated RAMP protein Csm5 [Sulfurihydrogenibium azorense]|uniref:type III-A CRISPR-associated RAMP protein Csm5 n=1 Tax=Sulfurihydrogenibium azorense TaxID=309806 RepID=UPI00391A03CD
MKFNLTVLSPIHIGNGNQISNWSYSYDERNKKIKIYNFEEVVKSLKDNVQRLINLTSLIERHPLEKSLGEVISSYGITVKPLYQIEFKGDIKRKNGNEYKPIYEFIKESGKVYIPGSEIKGAIRTALFYKILKDKFLESPAIKNKFLEDYKECVNVSNYRDERERRANIKKNFSNFIKRWESIAFRAGFSKVFDREFKQEDAKKDILKLLLVSDSDLKDPQECLEVQDIKSLGVSRGFRELHELLKVGTKFTIDLEVSFKEEYKELLPETYGYLDLELKKIKEACSEFANAILNEDIHYIENIKNTNIKNTNEINDKEKESILNKLKKRRELVEKGFFVLRLGKHQGFLSTTINLLVKELAPEVYSEVYPNLVNKGYKDKPNKSRKITYDNEFMGWCVLIKAE